jgi:hypothetical protein
VTPISPPEVLRHVRTLAIEGVGVAFFAWVFDLTRRVLFGGTGKAIRAIFDGWSTYSIAALEVSIERMKESITNPLITVGNMILGAIISTMGLTLFSDSLLLDFIREYYPPRGDFGPVLGTAPVPPMVLVLASAALIPAGLAIFSVEFRRLKGGGGRLAVLEKRKTQLEAKVRSRTTGAKE